MSIAKIYLQLLELADVLFLLRKQVLPKLDLGVVDALDIRLLHRVLREQVATYSRISEKISAASPV